MEAAYGAHPPTREIVERHRAGDPTAEAAFEELFVFADEDAGSFDRFQAKFNLLLVGSSLLDSASPAAMAREVGGFADAVREDHRHQGVTYAEQRVMLGRDLRSPQDEAVLSVLLDRYARAGDGVVERLALSLDREDPWPAWERLAELALGPGGEVLTGIDFCYIEEGHPPRAKEGFFAEVTAFNVAHPERALAILYHVGESFQDKSLEGAVRWVQEAAELGAHRLGHAIALGVDPDAYGPHARTETVAERRDQIDYDLAHAQGLQAAGVPVDERALDEERRVLAGRPSDHVVSHTYDAQRLEHLRRRQDLAMARVRRTGAVIEVCPTSNRRIAGLTDPAHHPVHRFLEAGLPVVVSSDDPGIFGVTLHDELTWVCEQTGGGEELRRQLVAAGWEHRSEVLSGRTAASPR